MEWSDFRRRRSATQTHHRRTLDDDVDVVRRGLGKRFLAICSTGGNFRTPLTPSLSSRRSRESAAPSFGSYFTLTCQKRVASISSRWHRLTLNKMRSPSRASEYRRERGRTQASSSP